MSHEIAIEVSNLSKCYHIYDRSHQRLLQSLIRKRKQYYREFWAIKDISLQIKKGETFGVIGRNGSGKSTLLQLICGTLKPTTGTIKTQGRIAALLELGSGFSPEYTGRENVYMNGALLGLTKAEIDNRFDNIAAFADIGEFIEQPVKTYSSGMQVRLAFSIITNVDAEILIIDEALSVGDAFFQAKCARVLRDFISRGTTILFVSHDTTSVKSLCQRALLLSSGRSVYTGEVNTVIEQYYSSLIAAQENIQVKTQSTQDFLPSSNPMISNLINENSRFQKEAVFQRIQNRVAEFLNVLVINEQEQPIDVIEFGQKIIIRQVLRINKAIPLMGIAYHIRDKNGLDIIYSDTALEGGRDIVSPSPGDIYLIDWHVVSHLREGDYVIASMASEPIDLNIGVVRVADFIPISCKFSVSRGCSLPIFANVWWTSNPKIKMISDRASYENSESTTQL
jgi:lipopolysaccharide transport system ATP-binding protein